MSQIPHQEDEGMVVPYWLGKEGEAKQQASVQAIFLTTKQDIFNGRLEQAAFVAKNLCILKQNIFS